MYADKKRPICMSQTGACDKTFENYPKIVFRKCKMLFVIGANLIVAEAVVSKATKCSISLLNVHKNRSEVERMLAV